MKMNKAKAYHSKMNPEELALYFHFRKRGFKVSPEKGKGSYEHNKMKKESK